jgi:hypothetical protein
MHPSITHPRVGDGDGNFYARGRCSFAGVKEVFRKPVPQCTLSEDFSKFDKYTNSRYGTRAVGTDNLDSLSCHVPPFISLLYHVLLLNSATAATANLARPLLAVGWCRLNRSPFTQSQCPVTRANGAPGEISFNQRTAFLLQVIRFFRNAPQNSRTSNSSFKGPRPPIT